jgi:hypothetical protein
MTLRILYVGIAAVTLSAVLYAAQQEPTRPEPQKLSVRGQLYVDGVPPRDFQVTSIELTLTPVDKSADEPIIRVKARAEGSFVLENVTSGRKYRVAATLPVGFLKAGRYGSNDALAGPIEIISGTVLQLQIGF